MIRSRMVVVEDHDFEDGQTAAIAGAAAVVAAGAAVQDAAFDILGVKLQLHEHVLGGREFLAAARADRAHQPLGDDGLPAWR